MNKFDFIDYTTLTNDNMETITIGNIKPIQECLTEEEIKKAMTNKSIFELTIEEKDKEIERLKNGYCELKVKCNNGECDCTNEEYDGMVQCNIKLSLENDELRNILEKMGINPNEILYLKNEIDELNNIIDELEKWLEENDKQLCLRKLRELKEGKENDK